MPCQCPGNATILQLLCTDLASECAIGFVKDILGGNFYSFTTEMLAREKQKDAWGSNDNLL